MAVTVGWNSAVPVKIYGSSTLREETSTVTCQQRHSDGWMDCSIFAAQSVKEMEALIPMRLDAGVASWLKSR
jgi:hypothetical protein